MRLLKRCEYCAVFVAFFLGKFAYLLGRSVFYAVPAPFCLEKFCIVLCLYFSFWEYVWQFSKN